ncbi:MAG: ferritin [Armatimonadetes bacterium]|nr:ferritin [Armatimonadota bacterium]
MLHEKMLVAINDQINKELYSAYLYQSMMAHFEALGLSGFANWMRVQSMEETLHAYKFYDYVIERGGKVTLTAIDGPETEWPTPLAAFEQVLTHEQFVTSRINNLMDIALEIRDHASASFLQWFIDEQVEEEASAEAIVQKLRLVGDNPNGLFMVDKDLGARVFVVSAGMPSAVGGGAA